MVTSEIPYLNIFSMSIHSIIILSPPQIIELQDGLCIIRLWNLLAHPKLSQCSIWSMPLNNEKTNERGDGHPYISTRSIISK